MTDPKPLADTAEIVLRSLRRTRQVRQFTDEPEKMEDDSVEMQRLGYRVVSSRE